MILHRTSLTTVRTVLEARQQRGPCAGGDQPRGCKLGEQGRGGGRVIRCLTDLGRSAPQPASPAQSRASASRAIPVRQPTTVPSQQPLPRIGHCPALSVPATISWKEPEPSSYRSCAKSATL